MGGTKDVRNKHLAKDAAKNIAKQRRKDYKKAIYLGEIRMGQPIEKFAFKSVQGRDPRTQGFRPFWDLENLRLPDQFVPKKLKSNIEAALKLVHPKYFVHSAIGYGNIETMTPDQYFDLTENGFTIHHCPRVFHYCRHCIATKRLKQGDVYERKSDSADGWLIESMLLMAADIRAPANLLILSSDADFATPIKSLLARHFRVYACVGENLQKDALMRSTTEKTWLWLQMCHGKGPIST